MNSLPTVQRKAQQINFAVQQQANFAKFGAIVKELFSEKVFLKPRQVVGQST
jgi:hypothetical protein